MICKNVEYGTYACSYRIKRPWGKERYINVDKCLLPEILQLWEAGIKTTGCCCGHDKQPPYIGVEFEHIEQMKKLGYKVQFNPCRPMDEDSFIPKTKLIYRR